MTTEKTIDFDQRLIAKDELHLYGKHVLFTTPRNYAGPLGELLLQRAARPVWMPTIEIWPMEDYRELDDIISNLSEYDWIAFTSENGVEPFCARLKALGLDAGAIGNTKIAAFRADSQVLEKHGIKADLIPGVMSPKGIIDGLIERGVDSGRVLVPCPQVQGVKEPYVVPEFIDELNKIGMTAQRLEVYRTVALKDSGDMEKNMILNGHIDIIVFTSSAEIFSLLEQLGDDRDVLNKATIAYMGSFTSKTGGEVGLNVDIVPEAFTMRGLIQSMESYFQN